MADLKLLLKEFGFPISGNKPILKERAFNLLQQQGASKLGPAIQNVMAKTSSRVHVLRSVSHSRNYSIAVQPTRPISVTQEPVEKSLESHPCSVRFKEATFHKVLESLVPPTILGKISYSLCIGTGRCFTYS